MTEIYSSGPALPPIPDDLTVAQFMLDYHHSARPVRDGVPCLIEDGTGRPIGFDELRKSTFGLANALSFKYNIGDGDVVLIFSPNHIDYPAVLWAVHRLGGVVTGANPNFTADELVYQLTSVNATLMIVHPSFIDTVLSAAHVAGLPSHRMVLFDPVPNDKFPNFSTVRELIMDGLSWEPTFIERTLQPGEGKTKLALLCFSSGTTGKPKAVAIAHYGLIANVIQMAAHNEVDKACATRQNRGYRPGDVAIGVLPFYHVAGLIINLHFVLFCAMSVVVLPKYDFLDMLDNIIRRRITHLILVPPQAITLCKHPAVKNYDLSVVTYVMVGAAPFAKEINQKLFEIFPTAQIGQAYGMTETSTTLAMAPMMQQRGSLGSGGQLIPGVLARVIKADGSLAGYGEPGELVVKSPSAALGYSNDEQATKETFVDGWIHTGDEVIIARNKEIFVFDRLKELLKVRGFQVAPAEIEGCLLGHPEIVDSCVVGIPDDYSGDIPLAFVVLSANALNRVALDPQAGYEIKANIVKHVADRKVTYKHLTGGVQFIDSIPKNGSGKLLRRLLRDRAKAQIKNIAKL